MFLSSLYFFPLQTHTVRNTLAHKLLVNWCFIVECPFAQVNVRFSLTTNTITYVLCFLSFFSPDSHDLMHPHPRITAKSEGCFAVLPGTVLRSSSCYLNGTENRVALAAAVPNSFQATDRQTNKNKMWAVPC